MKKNYDYVHLQYKSIACISDDGSIDINELNKLIKIALRDGVVDENEKRVLRDILTLIPDSELVGPLADKVNELVEEYGL
jgi:hypothetical protein